MRVSRKTVPLTADTGTAVGYTSRCDGELVGVAVKVIDAQAANIVTVSTDTGEPMGSLPLFVRSVDTGYDVLKADERAMLSGERLRVALTNAGGDTGQFGFTSTAFVYVKEW